MELVITILQLLCGLAIIVVVLFQSGKSAGLSGAIGGVADSFLSRNKAKTWDAKLARATKWVGALFLILTLILLILDGCVWSDTEKKYPDGSDPVRVLCYPAAGGGSAVLSPSLPAGARAIHLRSSTARRPPAGCRWPSAAPPRSQTGSPLPGARPRSPEPHPPRWDRCRGAG